jgi:hypothetical protein
MRTENPPSLGDAANKIRSRGEYIARCADRLRVV